MTNPEPESAPVDTSPVPPTTIPTSWRQAALEYALLIPPAAFVVLIIYPLAIFAVLSLFVLAVPYVVFMTVRIIRLRRVAAAEIRESDPTVDETAANFGTASQKLSLINAVGLGVTGVLGLAAMGLGEAMEFPHEIVVSIAIALLIVMTVFGLIMNRTWALSRQMVIAEEHAIRNRLGSAHIIQVNRRISWIIWYAGTILAIAMIVLYALQALNPGAAPID